jgi:hypothetical protein
MNELSPVYLSAIAEQVGALSAFLGGFAATFLAMMLGLAGKGRAASVAIGSAAVSSVAFIVAVVASTALTAVLHPEAPQAVAGDSSAGARAMMVLAFLLGLYALLLGLALSGWARSRATGWTTSIAAGIGIVLVSVMLVGIG